MERVYSQRLSEFACRSLSSSRQLLRALREYGLVPGHGDTPTAADIANIVLALSADTIATAPKRARALKNAP